MIIEDFLKTLKRTQLDTLTEAVEELIMKEKDQLAALAADGGTSSEKLRIQAGRIQAYESLITRIRREQRERRGD